MRILVTGAAGFIGSGFARLMLQDPPYGLSVDHLAVVDKLTYAGNLENLSPVRGDKRFSFFKVDLCDAVAFSNVVEESRPDAVVHFAAESHVDRSILGAGPFVDTNVRGTLNVVDSVRRHGVQRMIHVSTDEVYGSIPEPHEADESYPLVASSPYSASKAASDLLALSYFHTFKTPVLVTRASNNYGPYHFPEKLIPLMITNALEDRPLPVYGDGLQVRDWLYVEDHCRGIAALLQGGEPGQIYNISGNASLPNIQVIRKILEILNKPESLITYVTDRPGHDRRYALTSAKLERETGWRAAMTFDEGLRRTIEWYQQNRDWVARVKSGEYTQYYEANYAGR
jgi:dTDP-glucose 4,6-dehydratase